jgi:hypothetical protein
MSKRKSLTLKVVRGTPMSKREALTLKGKRRMRGDEIRR